jgi:hypothetical protein
VEYYEEQLERFMAEKTKDVEVFFDIVTVCKEMIVDIGDYMKNTPDQFSTLEAVSKGFVAVEQNQLVTPSISFDPLEPIGVNDRDGIYMMVRLHKIVVSAASASIEELGKLESKLLQKQKMVKASHVFKKLLWAAANYLKHALEIVPLQLYYLGGAHPDIAQTYLDIAEGISCAFSLTTKASQYSTVTSTGTTPQSHGHEQRHDAFDSDLQVNILHQLHDTNSEKFVWATSRKSAQQLMEKIRKEGERIANLYRPRYDILQERLVATPLAMPDAYL